MGDTFLDDYFDEDPILKKLTLLQEEIKEVKESIEDLSKRVSIIEERHESEDCRFYMTHKDDVKGDLM